MILLGTTAEGAGLPPASTHLEYFGFVGVDCGLDDSTDDEEKSLYLDEVAGFTNLGHLCPFAVDEDLAPRLEAFRQRGLKALLHLEPLLFDRDSEGNLVLAADGGARWNTFLENNRTVLTTAYIAALYVADEPYWNGLDADGLTAAVNRLQADLPDLPTLIVEAWPALDQLVVPDALDWIGFDRYDVLDPATDTAWQRDFQTVLAARTRPDQRLVVVAETQWLDLYNQAGYCLDRMAQIAWSTYLVALAHPEVIAWIGYPWPGGLDAPTQLGARGLGEKMLWFYQLLGRSVVAR